MWIALGRHSQSVFYILIIESKQSAVDGGRGRSSWLHKVWGHIIHVAFYKFTAGAQMAILGKSQLKISVLWTTYKSFKKIIFHKNISIQNSFCPTANGCLAKITTNELPSSPSSTMTWNVSTEFSCQRGEIKKINFLNENDLWDINSGWVGLIIVNHECKMDNTEYA